MKPFGDPLLLLLLALLGLSVVGFLTGAIPYPFGSLVLLIFIAARVLHKQ